MLDMQISGDRATAAWNGHAYACSEPAGATNALARLLMAAGCPDGPWRALRGTSVAFYGPSIHDWARWTHHETPRPHRVLYRER
jgi:hypothetical protein